MATKNAKKANLLDHHSLKHLLDESVSEVIESIILAFVRSSSRQFFSRFFFFYFFILSEIHLYLRDALQIVTSRGYVEDVRLSNVKLIMGTVIIIIALVAQFYKKKFPENRDFLIGCIILYPFSFRMIMVCLNCAF